MFFHFSNFSKTAYLAAAFFLLLQVRSSMACTTFSMPEHQNLVVGKSYDWRAGQGVGLVSQRGVSKTALDIDGYFTEPARWVSKYGSFGFTQFGVDLPLGGVNEKGLVVEIMWLDNSSYPAEKKLPQLNELQWIQYILDLASTTEEAISLAKKVQVLRFFAPVHYMVCDLQKQCASFEYLNKELVISRQSVQTLTNTPYKVSLASVQRFQKFGGIEADPQNLSAERRFVRASFGAQDLPQGTGVEDTTKQAFSVLDMVRVGTARNDFASRWQIVYQPAQNRIDFRIAHSQEVFTIDTSAFDFDCSSAKPVLFDLRGDVLGEEGRWRFVEYKPAVHHTMIFDSGNKSVGSLVPKQAYEAVYSGLHSRECLD